MCSNFQCAAPEIIHTPPKEGIGISCGVGLLAKKINRNA